MHYNSAYANGVLALNYCVHPSPQKMKLWQWMLRLLKLVRQGQVVTPECHQFKYQLLLLLHLPGPEEGLVLFEGQAIG